MDGALPLMDAGDGFFACPGRYLWHEASRTALLADLHLGAEAALSGQGIFLPGGRAPWATALLTAWHGLIEQRPAQIIIAGDLFHAPDPDPSAIDGCRRLLGLLPTACRITIIPGNHDPGADVLRTICAGRADIANHAHVAGFLVVHGHRVSPATSGTSADTMESILKGSGYRGIIVGHQHPAVRLTHGLQSAKMICFATAVLRLPTASLALIILPAFSHLPLGSNLLTRRHWLLDLPRPADQDIRIAGIIEPRAGPPRVLDFGPLDALRVPENS